MESSFFVSIENKINEPQLIKLFSGSLEASVIITTGKYDYQALQLIAAPTQKAEFRVPKTVFGLIKY